MGIDSSILKGENSRDYFNSPEEAYEDLYKNHVKKINPNPYYYIRSGALLGVTLSVDVSYQYTQNLNTILDNRADKSE